MTAREGVLVLGLKVFAILLGAVLIHGTARGWRVLVDPPRNVYSSQSVMLKILGKRGLILWNYFIGALFITFGLFSIFQSQL